MNDFSEEGKNGGTLNKKVSGSIYYIKYVALNWCIKHIGLYTHKVNFIYKHDGVEQNNGQYTCT